MKIKELGEKCIKVLYPPSLYCGCCGNIIDETRTYNLCDHCIRHIRWDTSGIFSRKGLKTLTCTEYGIYERTIIFSLKYNGKTYLARDIAEMMSDKLKLTPFYYDYIIAVPMNKGKEAKRGFNQAGLIGKYLGKRDGKRYIEDGLSRVKDTKPMRGLSPVEREYNVKNNFIVTPKWVTMLKDKIVLLVDDFYTTGSTGRECQRVLMEAGVKDVYFISFAAKSQSDNLD